MWRLCLASYEEWLLNDAEVPFASVETITSNWNVKTIVRRVFGATNTRDIVLGFLSLRLTTWTIFNYLTPSRKDRLTLKFSTEPYNERAYTLTYDTWTNIRIVRQSVSKISYSDFHFLSSLCTGVDYARRASGYVVLGVTMDGRGQPDEMKEPLCLLFVWLAGGCVNGQCWW